MNVALAKKVLTKVRKHPERHNQDEFISGKDKISIAALKAPVCGTTACLAGWASILTAPKGTVFNPRSVQGGLVFPDGSEHDIEFYAMDQLGLTSGQANALFYCFDNATAIKRLEYLTEHPEASGWELQAQIPSPETEDDF